MSESVEQAARGGWKARAEREAVAILDNTALWHTGVTRNSLIAMLAIAWLQGVNVGSHETLAEVEQAFGSERAEL